MTMHERLLGLGSWVAADCLPLWQTPCERGGAWALTPNGGRVVIDLYASFARQAS